MSKYLETLVARRQEAWKRAQDITSAAVDEQRDLSAEEDANLSAIDADISRYKKEEERYLQMEQRAKAGDEVRGRIEEAVAVQPEKAVKEPTDRDVLRSLWTGERSSAEFRGSPESFERRALGVGVGTTHPSGFADFVTVYLQTLSPVYGAARVFPRSSGEPVVFPRKTATATGSLVAEAGTVPSSDPTISQVTITPYKYGVINVFSTELASDNAINLEQLLAEDASESLGLLIGSYFTLGSGSSQPKGFVTAGGNGGTAAGTPFFTITDLITLQQSLAPGHRNSASAAWMVSTDALTKIRKFTDANGQLQWQPSAQVGQPDLLFGRPIYENPHMAAVASASKSVAFGNWSRYFILDVRPIRVERSTDWKFDTDQIAIKTIVRMGADQPDANAIKYLVSAAS